MDPKLEEAQGKVKQAIGDLTENEDLQKEGKADVASAKVKGAVKDAADKVVELVDKVKDAAT